MRRPGLLAAVTIFVSALLGMGSMSSIGSAVDVAASAYAWGNGRLGALGDGTNDTFPNPQSIDKSDWNSVSASNGYSIGLKQDGSLWWWGSAPWDPTATPVLTPKRVDGANNWANVDAGGSHVLALRTDGTMWAWGVNVSGQLGNGTTTGSSTPVQIGAGQTWKAIAAGYRHSVALRSDNTLWTWGANDLGQLGDGTSTNRTSPKQILPAVSTWKSISSGGDHTLALRTNGTLWSWGDNSSGALGDGTTTKRTTPTQITSATTWSVIGGGAHRSSALRTDGTLWTWGLDGNSQPTKKGTDADWASVSAGDHYFAFKNDGSLYAWGANRAGELGDGTNSPRPQPVKIGDAGAWIAITASADQNTGSTPHSLGIRTDGTLWAWGSNEYGQIGNGDLVQRGVPGQVDGAASWARISSGGEHVLAVKADGTLWAWGDNSLGQLGRSDIDESGVPVEVLPDTTWLSIAAGKGHSLAVKTDGTLWAWGENTYGQLGDGSSPPDGTLKTRPTPEQVGIATNWESVAGGFSHSLGVRTDGSLWAWGHNFYGQLGDGSKTHRTAPVRVGAANDWNLADAGSFHSLALKDDGRLFTWGDNIFGQLGDGTTTGQTQPKALASSTWRMASAGMDHTMGIRSDGALLSWGTNVDGQLGDGSTTQRNTPVMIGSAKDWATIDAGASHSLGVKNDGSLHSWGNNFYGQLGDGTTDTRRVPASVGSDKDWKSVYAGGSFSIALKTPTVPPPTTTTVPPPTTTTVPPPTTTATTVAPPTTVATTTTVPTSVLPTAVFASPDPVGSIDVAEPVPQGMRVAGWTLDPDVNSSIGVHIYVDGVFARGVTADLDRPDVGAAFAGFGNAHGYNTTIPSIPGVHSICTYGINEGPGGNVFLGCRNITIGTDPFGSFDLASITPGGTKIAGWAIDPNTAEPVDLHIYTDGAFSGAIGASAARADIDAAFPGYGTNHGFDGLISLASGFHTVCAYGINQGVGTNTLVGCRWVVASNDPFGSLDIATNTNTTLRVAGWVLDPDTADPLDLHVYIDGVLVSTFEADLERSDVSSTFTGFGALHGFDKQLVVSSSPHQVCVYAINKGSGSNALITCRAV